MAITGAQRLELHQTMRGLVGVGPADTLMECLPFDGWDGIARVEHVELATTRMEAKLEQRIAEVRIEMGELRTELKDEIGGLRVEMHQGFARQNRWMAGYMLTFIVGMIIALVR